MNVHFDRDAWADLCDLAQADQRTLFLRLLSLIEACRREPFRGLGKPEPLKGDLSGWWSRRIDREHRLVYRVAGASAEQRLEIAQCRYHY